MENTQWMIAVGGASAFLHCVGLGATMPAQCWGPLIGAKVVQYRTAVIFGVVFQAAGMLAFGSETYTMFSDMLDDWGILRQYPPRLTLYVLMWIQVTPVIWHALSIWRRMLLPGYIATIGATLGASLAFPGAGHIKVGGTNSRPPYLQGMGAVFIAWFMAPLVTMCGAVPVYLWNRKVTFRSEDPFYRALWRMPWHACISAVVAGLALIYAIESPRGTTWFLTTPQGSCIILAAVGSAVCILYTVSVPCMTRHMRSKLPPSTTLKRMNLLGLDEATVRELTVDDSSKDMTGWLQRTRAYLFQADMFASVSSNDTLMRIHSTAEEYDKATEDLFAPLQKVLAVFLSLSYGTANGHVTFGALAMMRNIAATNEVAATSSLGMGLRCASAAGLTLGSLLFGARIVPVTGVQLVKMTPYRSYITIFHILQSVAILSIIGLRGGIHGYSAVSAVVAVGLVEGTRHVNWRMLVAILKWWVLGYAAVVLGTALLVAQGIHTPSLMVPSDYPNGTDMYIAPPP